MITKQTSVYNLPYWYTRTIAQNVTRFSENVKFIINSVDSKAKRSQILQNKTW